MKVLKGFNNISAELQKEIQPLKGTKTFRLLTGVPIFDPETGTSETHFGKTLIPTRDRIKDPYSGDYVDIGVVSNFNAQTGEVIDTRRYIAGLHQTNFNGMFDLIEGKVADEELWEFLCISNFNGSNPHRDKSHPPMYELVDVYAEGKKKRANRNSLRDALNVAEGMHLNDVREFVLAMGHDDKLGEDDLRDVVEEYAKENPTEFLQAFKDPAFKLQAFVKRAANADIIQYNPSNGKVKWSGTKGAVITAFPISEGVNWIAEFAEYCLVTPAGQVVMKGIKKRLNGATVDGIKPDSDED